MNWRKRLARHGLQAGDVGLEEWIRLGEIAQEEGDQDLIGVVEERVAAVEAALGECPFVEPAETLAGTVPVGTTRTGKSVGVSFLPGKPESVQHGVCTAASGVGKTCLLASLVAGAATECNTLFIGSTGSELAVQALRKSHRVVRFLDLRLDFFPRVSGVDRHWVAREVARTLAERTPMITGELEINDTTETLFRNGSDVSLPGLIDTLRHKTYKGFSNRQRYRETAVLQLTDLSWGTEIVFCCQQGMDLRSLLSGNTVLDMQGIAPRLRGFLIAFVLLWVRLLAQVGLSSKRPLLVCVDETADVVKDSPHFDALLLQARHAGIQLVLGFQNAADVPPRVMSNVGLVIGGRQLGQRDRWALGSAMNLQQEQMRSLSDLGVAEFLVSLPGRHRHPVLVHAMPVTFETVNEQSIAQESQRVVSQWSWEPLVSATQNVDSGKDERKDSDEDQTGPAGKGLGDHEAGLLRDIWDERRLTSTMTERCLRIGIVGSAERARVVKRLREQGWIETATMSIGRGRPPLFAQITPEGATVLGRKLPKRTPGGLRVRIVTQFSLQQWNRVESREVIEVIAEGRLSVGEKVKAVDVLIRGRGRLECWEVAGNERHERRNARHCLEAGADQIVTVCVSEQVKGAVVRSFGRDDVLCNAKGVVVVTLAEVLADSFVVGEGF